MNEQWQVPPPYLAAPRRSRGKFWKYTTGVVLIAVIALVAVTWLQGFFRKDEAAPTASTLDSTDTSTNEPASDAGAAEDPQSDADNDGLVLFDEERYGTNASDPDTDKDGYPDGQEVINGYNPNGAGRLSIEAEPSSPLTEDPNRKTLDGAPNMTGIPLTDVFDGKGAYLCRIEGGATEKNTVTLKVKDNKVRQETPINGSTMVFIIVDQKTLYLSSFEGSKFLQLSLNAATATATGSGATIRGGIFANESLVLASNPTAIGCEESALAEDEFTVKEDQILKLP
ncbi:MAG: hypothetical protein V1895_01270 [Parcubacteria group bacterium]